MRRIACIEGLGYPASGDRVVEVVADMLGGRVDLLVLVCPLSEPKPRLLELLVSELVDALEAPVAVAPCDCEAADLAEAGLAARRGGGHPLHEEPMLVDGVGVAAALWFRGGCGVETPRWLDELYAGRLLSWYAELRESGVSETIIFSRRGWGLALLAAQLIAAVDHRVRVQAGCGDLSQPTIIEAGRAPRPQ